MQVEQGAVFYYSGSGNTRLACRYLAQRIEDVTFEFIDVTDGAESSDLDAYDIVGFATFTDFFAPPYRFQAFLRELPPQEEKPAFVFNTYGSFSGKTLPVLEELAADRGFDVIAGHSLHTPESYPPLNAMGITSDTSPNREELEAFNRFIDRLAAKIQTLQAGGQIETANIRLGLVNRLLPALPRTTSRVLMGQKRVDESLCTQCGLCVRVCPYDATALKGETPVFDEERCYGCWACYNHCPEQAIYTRIYNGVGHYPQPNGRLQQKLST